MSYEKFVKGVVRRVGFETKIRFENDGELVSPVHNAKMVVNF